MFGSSLCMAPEEFELGAIIDQRTTTYTLGRLIWHFGTGLTERGRSVLRITGGCRVTERACQSLPAERYDTVAEFARAWRLARALT